MSAIEKDQKREDHLFEERFYKAILIFSQIPKPGTYTFLQNNITPPIQRFTQCLFSWCYICYSTRPSSPQARERLVAWRRRSFPSRKEFLPCWEEMNGNETYSCIILIFMWCIFAVFFEIFFHQLLGFLQCHTSSVPKNEKRSFPEKPTGLNPLIHGQGPITGHVETSGPTAPKHHSTGEPSRDQGLTNDSRDPHDGSLHAKHRYMQPRKISPKVCWRREPTKR